MDRRVIVLSAAQLALPAELQALAGVFTLDLPGPDELKANAERVVADLSRQRPIRVDLTPADFDQLVERMRGFTELEAERAITKTVLRDGVLSRSGLEAIVEIKKELLQKEGILEYIAPEENLAEVGGFRNLKTWLAKRKRAFAPEAKRFGLAAPRGILLLGVQGAGKTLVARAIAREWELPLRKMETGRLYDKYVGESEKNLDKALRTAEQMAPCVLMIDELEKALSYSPSGDSDAGLSKRILGRLLGWLQDRKAPVFEVTTSNNIAELPPELMRKGRFDEIFFVDLPHAEERKEIFAAIGDPQGGNRRPPRVGPRARGDGELKGRRSRLPFDGARERGDVVLDEERVDEGDGDRAQESAGHERAPVEDVAAHELGENPDRNRLLLGR